MIDKMWLVTFVDFCYGWSLWVFLTWLPSYLKDSRGLDLKHLALITSLPLLAGVVGDTLGGVASDQLYKRTGSLKIARRAMIVIGLGGALVFILPVVGTKDAETAVALLAASFFFLELTNAVLWSLPMDIAGRLCRHGGWHDEHRIRRGRDDLAAGVRLPDPELPAATRCRSWRPPACWRSASSRRCSSTRRAASRTRRSSPPPPSIERSSTFRTDPIMEHLPEQLLSERASGSDSPVPEMVARARAAQRVVRDVVAGTGRHGRRRRPAGRSSKPARNRELAELAVATTGIGNVDDKVRKNHRKTLGLLRDLQGARSRSA